MVARLQDEPIADPVCVPVYYVSQARPRQRRRSSAQVGEGADELFCGYPSWRTLLQLQRADDLPGPVGAQARSASAALAARAAGRRRARSSTCAAAPRQPIFWSGAEAFTERQKQRLLAPACARELDGLSSWDALAADPSRDSRRTAGELATSTG